MKTEGIYRLLDWGQTRLNFILISTTIIKGIIWFGGGAGVFILTARCLGWMGTYSLLWTCTIFIGGITGFIYGWLKRLDQMATARWLDQYLHNQEALTAAIVCINRNYSGLLDYAVIERAEVLSEQKVRVEWPLRYLFRYSGVALSVIIGFSLLFILWIPRFHPQIRLKAVKVAENHVSQHDSGRRNYLGTSVSSLKTIAQKLFPENDKMAALAEQALRTGDIQALQSLLKQAQMNMETQIAQSSSINQRQQLQRKMESRQQLSEEIMADMQNAATEDQVTSGGRSGNQGTPKNGKANKANSKMQSNSGRYPYESGSSDDFLSGTGAEDSKSGAPVSAKGGLKPGTGQGSERGNWNLNAKTGLSKAIIAQLKNGNEFVYVLPGKNIHVPLSQFVADAKRTTEAALTRRGVPSEYEDFVKSYFLRLSQESVGNTPKEDQ